ncbi:MAG: LuxR C-terminal-related transcriptional regulator [Anaerolineae bacterium]
MSTALLATKLYVPAAGRQLVPRSRLVARLDEGLDLGRRLTLVAAPAGFGKTTLVGAWLRSAGKPVAWLSLDEGDDDEARFWTYLVAALQTVHPGLGQGAVQLLGAPRRPAVEVVLTSLLNELAGLPGKTILVLDDYHLIVDPAIHQGVTFLLEHLPPGVHLVLSTRADPALPVYRLRARGQLTELRAGDLRFTAGEAAAFLNSVMGLDLARDDVEALEARTEGWIVGLQLAALSLQGRADAHEFIATFGGGHHYVLEYLTHEVVRRQPAPVRRFLIETSILDRFCGPLCDAVLGEGDGQAMLAHLRQRDLFIVPLDDEHRWHRYHQLFADLLGNLLRQERSPDEIRALHLRAAGWYDEHGLAAEAVRHALAAGDYSRTARLIERYSLSMVTRGELATLLRWIEALPEEVAHSRPWLCVHQAWPLTLAGKAGAAEPLLRRIEALVPPDSPAAGDREILGNAAAMRALLANMHGDMSHALEWARRADELLPADNLIPRHMLPFILASAHLAAGDLVQAEGALRQELALGRASGNLWTVVRTLCDLAGLHLVRGQLREAERFCREALAEAEAREGRQFGTVGYVLVKLAEIDYERYDLAAARDRAQEGVALMQGWQQPYEMVQAYTVLAAILQALGDVEGAREALDSAEAMQAQHPAYPRLDSLVRCCRVRLLLARGEAGRAARRARDDGLGSMDLPINREQEQVLLARVFAAGGRGAEALSLLAELAEAAGAGGRLGPLVEILSLQAAAHQARGDTAAAAAALERALTLAGPEGQVRAFVEASGAGAPLAPLLRRAAGRGVVPQHVARLLVALGAGAAEAGADVPDPAPAPAPAGAPPLVEPLTERELEVLRLMAAGQAHAEIAAALVISINTVKKHAAGIYGKLGVHSRTQAVVRAQELGLL